MTATEKAILYIIQLKVQAGNDLNGSLLNRIAQEVTEVDLNMNFVVDKYLTDRTQNILENVPNLHRKAEKLREMYEQVPAMKDELTAEIKKLSTSIDC